MEFGLKRRGFTLLRFEASSYRVPCFFGFLPDVGRRTARLSRMEINLLHARKGIAQRA